MQIGQAQIVRQVPVDRNFVDQGSWYAATSLPHARTQRDSYTVTAGKILVINVIGLILRRAVAATVSGDTYGSIEIVTPGPSIFPQIKNYLSAIAIDSWSVQNIGLDIRLPEGTAVNIYSKDGSTNGQVEWRLGWGGYEYDA